MLLNGTIWRLLFIWFLLHPLSHSIVYHSTEDHYAFLELAKKFPSVGMLSIQLKSKDNKKLIKSYCSGVLIDPLTVLTVADCINPLLHGEFEFDPQTTHPGANTFKLGDDVYNKPLAMAKIKGAVFYPGHKHDNLLTQAQNLALLYLEKPIYNVEPATLYTSSMESFSQTFFNKKVVLVGFGFHGLPWNPYSTKNNGFLPSSKEIDFHKRACFQKITNFRRSIFETQFSIDNGALFGMFTHVDQGGGMFMEHKGTWYLVGINSHRINPTFSQQITKDERDVSYETKGISLTVPSYAGWIKENQALRTVKRSGAVDNSEWTFAAYWKKGIVPHNNVADSALFHADINTPSTIIVDNFISIEQLSLRHKNANVFIPPKLSVKLSPKEVSEHLESIWGNVDDDTSKSLDNDAKFGAIEYQRSLISQGGSDDIFRMLKVESRIVSCEEGILDVNGELWSESFHLRGGTLQGGGTLIYGPIPIVNTGAVVMPGPKHAPGTLTMVGDYEQRSVDHEAKNVATLRIRVLKERRRITNSVLNVQGEARLGGKLVIEEIGEPLVHQDRIKFLHGKHRQKFAHVVLPRGLSYEMQYGGDSITLIVKDPWWQQNIVVTEQEKLTVRGPKLIRSLLLNGGELNILGRFKLSDGPWSVASGTLSIGKGIEPVQLTIIGNYEQTDGTLKLFVQKILTEIQNEKEYVINADGSITPIEEAPKQTSGNRITQKIGTPEYIWTSDSLHVQGIAKLGGHVEIDFGAELLIKEGIEIPFITAQKIEGVFNSVSKLPGLIQPVLSYTDTQVILGFKNMGTLSSIPYKSRQAALAAKILDLERLENRKTFASLYLVLNGLSPEAVENMLEKQVIPSKAFPRMLQKYETALELIGEQNMATLQEMLAAFRSISKA